MAYRRDQVRSAAEEGASLCVTVESVSNLHSGHSRVTVTDRPES
jgi:hypothetical protein